MLRYGAYAQSNASGRNAYQNANIETADRGKLVVMVYDHCIRWCRVALDAIEAGRSDERTKAILRVQHGITELMCALDFEKGGDISKNLYRLYDFYNRHLSEANVKNSAENIRQVQAMMESLRSAWVECFDKLRRQGLLGRPNSSDTLMSLRG